MQSKLLVHKTNLFNMYKIQRLKVCLLTLFPSDCSFHHVYKYMLFVIYIASIPFYFVHTNYISIILFDVLSS